MRGRARNNSVTDAFASGIVEGTAGVHLGLMIAYPNHRLIWRSISPRQALK